MCEDRVHVVVSIPPKVSVSDYMGVATGDTPRKRTNVVFTSYRDDLFSEASKHCGGFASEARLLNNRYRKNNPWPQINAILKLLEVLHESHHIRKDHGPRRPRSTFT